MQYILIIEKESKPQENINSSSYNLNNLATNADKSSSDTLNKVLDFYRNNNSNIKRIIFALDENNSNTIFTDGIKISMDKNDYIDILTNHHIPSSPIQEQVSLGETINNNGSEIM